MSDQTTVEKCMRCDCKYFHTGNTLIPCATCVCNNNRASVSAKFNYRMKDGTEKEREDVQDAKM